MCCKVLVLWIKFMNVKLDFDYYEFLAIFIANICYMNDYASRPKQMLAPVKSTSRRSYQT